MSPGALMTAAEVAAYLGRPAAWVRGLLADGAIPGAYQHRARWLVPRANVEAWVRQGAPSAEPARPLAVMPRRFRRDAA